MSLFAESFYATRSVIKRLNQLIMMEGNFRLVFGHSTTQIVLTQYQFLRKCFEFYNIGSWRLGEVVNDSINTKSITEILQK